MNITDRIKFYNKTFNKYPPLVCTGRWVYGVWMIGNNYQSKNKYYGEYPPSYLKRVMCMFEDISSDEILHLFSGTVDERGVKFDINQDLNPDIVGDAEKLSDYFQYKFKLIIADPPYTCEDSTHYGTAMVNRNKVIKECCKILDIDGYIVWLDQVLPMYRKDELQLVGTIGLVRSTNHRFRVVSIFRRV